MDQRFAYDTYLVRRKVLALFSPKFHIYDPDGNLVFFSKQKAFRLKEDIRLYTDEDMHTEDLVIKARQIIDFSAAYDVIDPATNAKVGALKRKGFSSILRDQWIIMDAEDRDIGSISEDSAGLAAVRRFLTNLLPQTFHGTIDGAHVCTFRQHFNPFVLKMTLDFSPDASGLLDRRLGIAAAVLLAAIEGRQG
jgi:uncharacterized protein YxjI